MGRIPREPPFFLVRTESARLRCALEGPAGVVVLTGLRGTGKSHLAAEYARSLFGTDVALVGWVNAETPGSTVAGLADIAERLGVAAPDGDSVESARRLRDHLSGGADPALLVLDNATDPDRIGALLPTGGRTRILVTSVDRSFGALGEVVDISCFTRPEAVHYLAEATGLGEDGADQVAADLGDLPLALSAATATITGRRLGYGEYGLLLHESPLPTVLRRRAGHDYPRSVVQAILLCIDTVEAPTDDYGLDLDVAWLLGVMAMLSPGGVHRSLLAVAARRVDDAVERCVTGSLLSWSTSGEALLMHRLVGRVLRERGRDTVERGVLRRIAGTLYRRRPAPRTAVQLVRSALAVVIANTFPSSQAWSRRGEGAHLVDQIDALWETEMVELSTRRHAVGMLNARRWAVEQLIEAADTARALTLAQDVARSAERLLGAAHPDTFLSRNRVARAFVAAGRFDAACEAAAADLTDAERALGPGHAMTLALRGQLASAYHSAGKPAEAEARYREALVLSRRVFGPEAPETLALRTGLAQARQAAGQVAEAVALFEEVLSLYIRVLGTGHAETFRCRHHLAHCYGEAGRTGEAVPLLRANLEEAVRAFGADHPSTLAARNNLALAYQALGRFADAIRLGEANLTERLRVLGPDHPDTLLTRHNLAHALYLGGRLDEAVALYEMNVDDFRRVLGPDHQYSLLTRAGLGIAYSAAGRHEEAIAVQEATLRDRLRVLGPRHPQTLHAVGNLADALAVYDLPRAISLFEQNLLATAGEFGPDHPDTLRSRHNLAAAYQAAGRLDEALTHFEENLADRLRILGPDSAASLESRDNLAAVYRAAGRLDRAIELFGENLTTYQRLLPGHRRLRTLRGALATTLREAGRLDEAIPLYETNIDDYRRALGPAHSDTVRAVYALAGAYHAAGRHSAATDVFETAYAQVVRVLGSAHPLASDVRAGLTAARGEEESGEPVREDDAG
ncbi:FxSxx-COOH system tetratricopeptide repeat protein [Nocardia sp. X0981]